MRLDNHKRFLKIIETTKVTETHTEQQPTALTIRLLTIGHLHKDLLQTPIDHFWADL